MLTIKNGIYERILRPVEIKHCRGDFDRMVEVTTIPQKWQFMVPMGTQSALGMYKGGSLTYIVNGKKSCHHDSTDSNRAKLKESMKGCCSRQYEIMHKHIHNMIWTNAAIECYKEDTNNSNGHIYIKSLSEYMERKADCIKDVYNVMVTRLGYKLEEMYDEIVSDIRISYSMKKFIRKCISDSPEKVIEILVFLALFDSMDKDEDFYTEFESHFLGERNDYDRKCTTTPQLVVEDYIMSRGDSEMDDSEIKSFNPSNLQKLLQLNSKPDATHVCDLSVELVFSNGRWWALICL